MNRSFRWPPLLLVLCLSTPVLSAPAAEDVHGTWVFTEDGCTDRYEFRADGSFLSRSGAEVLKGSFTAQVLATAEPANIQVTRVVAADNLGKDCGGSWRNDVGRSDVRFVAFNDSRSAMRVCSSPAGTRCFGPLTRISPGAPSHRP